MRFIRFLSLACVLAFAGSLILRAADAPPAEPKKANWQQLKADRLVPDNACVYLSTPDVKKARAAFERSAIRGLVGEEDISSTLVSTFASIRDAYIKGDGTRSEAELRRRSDEVDLLTRITPLLDGEVALAIDAESFNGNPRFLVVGSMPAIDGDQRQRVLEELMDRFRYQQLGDPKFKDSDDTAGNYDVHRLENPELGLIETWAFVENLFIYGQGKGIVEDAINRFSLKNGAGTMALNAGYQTAYNETARDTKGDAALYFQADATPLLKNFAFGDKINFAGAGPHVAVGVQIGDGEKAPVKEKIFLRMSPSHPDSAGSCKSLSAHFAPRDTLYYEATQSGGIDGSLKDVLASFAAGAKSAPDAPPGSPAAPMLKRIGDSLAESPFLKEMTLYKGEMSFFVTYVPQSSITTENFFSVFQTVFALELDRDNPAADGAFKAMIGKVETGTKQAWVGQVSEGATIRYQKGAVRGEELRGNAGPPGLWANLISPALQPDVVPFFVSYARVDVEAEPGGAARKFVLFSDSLEALRKAVAQSRLPRSSLAEQSKFKSLINSFREARYQVSFLDLPRLVDVYNSQLPALMRSEFFTRDESKKLPSPSTLRDHVFPMAWASSPLPKAGGILVESSSPTGDLPLLMLSGSVAWPKYVESRAMAISTLVDTNFREIFLGMYLYAADNDRFPQQLSDLVPNYVKLEKFNSPFKHNAVKTAQDVDDPNLSNIIYIPNKTLQDLGSDILLYEKDPTKVVPSKSGSSTTLLHHVLTVDGKKQFLPHVAIEMQLTGKDFVTSTLIDASAGKTEKK